jgi:ATP-dependent Clp protease ATP-binding subunit ClpX
MVAAKATPIRRDDELLAHEVQPMDLVRYGFIPEFIGRLPVVGVLNDLDKETLVQDLVQAEERDYQAVPAAV